MKTKQPRKQRRQLICGDLNRLRREMGAHLSKSLREKYKKRSITIRKGDDVKIMRGKFSDATGIVERVDLVKGRIYIEGIQVPKADGTKAKVGILPSNVMITKLNLNDKRRIAAPETKEKGAKE
jgi:large subunit ribosomal protein L24